MANANSNNIIDYAMPMINIEKVMRRIHDHCLSQDFSSANELCAELITEARILTATLGIMQAKQNKTFHQP